MSPSVLVLPSPLLPHAAYRPLLVALRHQGRTPALADATAPRSGQDLIDRWSALARSAPPGTIVAHSNAGYLAPAVRAESGVSSPIVFVDAALLPERGLSRLAPQRFRERLSELSEGSNRLLPPWTRWWPREAMADAIPAEMFDEIDAQCARVALDYFDSEVSAPDDWTQQPNAYLAFGDTYADETAFATAHGWPVGVQSGTHLQFLWEPMAVSKAIMDLCRQLVVSP